MFEATGDLWGLAIALNNLGLLALQQGDYERASALYQRGLTLFWHEGDKALTARCFEELAWLAYERGDYEQAVRLFATSEALREAIGSVLHGPTRVEHDANVSAVRAHFDEATFAAAWAEGRAMTMEQAVAYALGEED